MHEHPLYLPNVSWRPGEETKVVAGETPSCPLVANMSPFVACASSNMLQTLKSLESGFHPSLLHLLLIYKSGDVNLQKIKNKRSNLVISLDNPVSSSWEFS